MVVQHMGGSGHFWMYLKIQLTGWLLDWTWYMRKRDIKDEAKMVKTM